MNLENTWLYVQAAFNAFLIQDKDDIVICENIERFYPMNTHFDIIRNKEDDIYRIETPSKRIVAINGTKDDADWNNNYKCWTNKYFHDGISDSFYRSIAEPIVDFAKGYKKPFEVFGHSQGCAHAGLAVLTCRERLNTPDIQAMGLCGPMMNTPAGLARMGRNKVRMTSLLMPGDVVSLVGGIVVDLKSWKKCLSWAKHYGKIVKLPEIEKHIIYGHKPSVVLKSLKQLCIDWKKDDQIQYIDLIKHVAKI